MVRALILRSERSERLRACITIARRLERGACGRPSRRALTRPPQSLAEKEVSDFSRM